MLPKFIFFCLIFIVIGGGFIFFKQPSMINQIKKDASHFIPALKDVKGISTDKAGVIPGQLKSNIDKGLNEAQKQARDIKVGDLMDIVNRTQKFAKDFRQFQEYIKKEVENFGKQSGHTAR